MMHKTAILGDTIKHIKQLQEKVKELELAVAQHKNTKSVVVVKKYQLLMNEDIGDNDDDDDDDNSSSSILIDDISSSGDNNNNRKKKKKNNSSSLPEIEVKISDNSYLLKVYCEKRSGIISELIRVVDKHGLSITSSVVFPFDNLTLDITIVTQMEEGVKINLKGFVRTLRSALRSISP